ncbi:CCA tRNA nucleotidyltransferase, mitochondrial [Trapelia coarctata]|nr:CCA tRNA nucleotidyltransferase, mitochondrial [Trapelia coarctata]
MKEITLTDQEKTLRQLLLDVADYIGTQDGCKKPELRITGGWVRDKLLGITSHDIDIGIDTMTGYKFGTLMKQYLGDSKRQAKYGEDVLGGLAKIEANPEKSKHLETVATKILGLEIDLVNLRKEVYAEDSRNPAMEFGTPVEDALRRDSTVNSLFYNLSTSQIEDLTERGLQDMALGVIRTPLSPYQTFKDDPLRVLRCIRFASKLGYSIDPEAEQAMSDPSIKEALRAKISRERVGIEVEKMLKGPRPYYALSLIDRLGLYNTIFTDPSQTRAGFVDTSKWKRACDHLSYLLGDIVADKELNSALQTIRGTLVASSQDAYLVWLLCALTPWTKVKDLVKGNTNTKKSLPMAAAVAREGLKADNKSINVIKDAVLHYEEVIASKDALANEARSVPIPTKRKQPALSREGLGMSVRRWGPHWRSTVIYAMLVESLNMEGNPDRYLLVLDYNAWLTHIKHLDLLEAHAMKPIVDGKQLMRAFGKKSGGPWLVAALNMIMEWQLRNTANNSQEEAIAEVKERRKELGID